MSSFTSTVKDEVINLGEKSRKCCSFSLLYGFLFCAVNENNKYYIKTTNVEIADSFIKLCDFLFKKKHMCFYKNGKISIDSSILRFSTIDEYKSNVFKCDDCIHYFLRGIFLARGSLTDPEKSYLFEITLTDEDHAKKFLELLNDINLNFKLRERQGKFVVYTKDSETIEDFLAIIGAQSSAFVIMNNKIIKDLKNRTNRIMNCDDANINKSLLASKKYLSAIDYLIKTNNITRLPEQLQEAARLRMEYKELNYSELGKKFNPAISKSGVFHRLEKIFEISEEFKKEK